MEDSEDEKLAMDLHRNDDLFENTLTFSSDRFYTSDAKSLDYLVLNTHFHPDAAKNKRCPYLRKNNKKHLKWTNNQCECAEQAYIMKTLDDFENEFAQMKDYYLSKGIKSENDYIHLDHVAFEGREVQLNC
ncbi:hypothetical protein BKA93DRAFT_754582 [Sparassis latifolia]